MTRKIRFVFSLIAACLFSAASVHATVTLQFSLAGTARATGFSNSAGLVGIDGMRWGLIVDTNNNGFSGTQYDGGFGINSSGFLTVNGIATDDYYVANAAQTTTSTTGATGGDPGGSGTITAISGVPFGNVGSVTNLIDVGDPFALVWFESGTAAGNKYGMLGNQSVNPQFDIPADGATTPYATFFAGASPDAIKPTNFTFQGAPEPSRLILLGLGGLGLVFRRRRC